ERAHGDGDGVGGALDAALTAGEGGLAADEHAGADGGQGDLAGAEREDAVAGDLLPFEAEAADDHVLAADAARGVFALGPEAGEVDLAEFEVADADALADVDVEAGVDLLAEPDLDGVDLPAEEGDLVGRG